jgi:hypothetical protein
MLYAYYTNVPLLSYNAQTLRYFYIFLIGRTSHKCKCKNISEINFTILADVFRGSSLRSVGPVAFQPVVERAAYFMAARKQIEKKRGAGIPVTSRAPSAPSVLILSHWENS